MQRPPGSKLSQTRCALLSLALIVLHAGCAGGERDAGGAAHVVIAGEALVGDVDTIVVTVSGGAGSAFDPIDQRLSKHGSEWRAYITSIPAGPARQFDIAAYDSLWNRLYAGSATSDIAPASVSSIAVVLQPWPELPPVTTSTPIIDSVTASPGAVPPGGDVLLTAAARDPDPGDAVSYAWAATCGTFTDAAGPAVTWTAPASDGSCELAVRVADTTGASVSVSLVIDVRSGTALP